MRRFTSLVSRAALAASALTCLAAPAGAQQIERIVVFGDSYADSGNAFALGYANPQAQAIYSTGRFSGGVNYVDVLANFLGVPVENYAIGGALASQNNTLLCFDPVYGAPLCGKGFQYEVDQFLGVGPQSDVFPVSDITLDQQDLVSVSIGGNDSRLYQQVGGSLAGAPIAGAGTAALASAQLDRVVAGGTPTISFIAGNTGRLPEIAGDPAGAAVRTAFSASFNNAMQQTLAGYAANGSIVHYLDLNLVLDNIIADPAAYGITSGIACPPAPDLTCLANSSGYLFYLDGLHLTSAGFTIVAKYVDTQLRAPLTLQAPADLGVDSGRQFGRVLASRSDLAGDSARAQGLRVFIVGDGFTRRVDTSLGNDSFRSTTVGITAGAEYAIGSGVVGVAGNVSRPKANFGNDSADVRTKTAQIGAYAGAGFGGGYLLGYAGYGWDNHDIDRTGVVEGMSASPDGHHWAAGVKGGYLMPMGGLRIGPVAALDYAKAKVHGYTENGDPALTLNVSSQSYRSLRGQIGAEARFDLGDAPSGAGFHPYASAVLEKELKSSNRSITFSQTASPIIVNHFDFADTSKRAYGRASVGGNVQLMANATLDAGVSLTFGKRDGEETSGYLGLKLGF